MRASLVAISTMLLVASPLVVGCDRDAPDSGDESAGEAAQTQQADQATDQLDEDVVIAGGDVELTIEDVEEAVDRLRLMAPAEDGRLPDDEAAWMRQPQAQVSLVRNLEHFAIVRAAADERDLEVDEQDLRDALADHDMLDRYLPLLKEDEQADQLRERLREVGLDAEDVRHLARDIAYDEVLEDYLAENFSDDHLWAIYQEAQDAADVVVASLANTPTPAEIDSAVQRFDAEIREHYRDHRDRYMSPPSAELTILEAPGADAETLEEAADRLAAGDDHDQIADELGLDSRTEVAVSRHENPEAHADDTDVGATGVLSDRQFGPYAWRLDDYTEPRRRQLDRPLRREIASQIMQREEGITPSSKRRAREARQILADFEADGPLDSDEIESLTERLEADGFDAVHTGFFSVRQAPRLPEIGLAENLFEAVGELDFDEPVTEPVLDRDSIHVARLVDRKHPERETWEEQREEFRAEFIEANRHQLVDQLVADYRDDHDFQYRTDVVAEHFGIDHDKPAVPDRK